MNAVSHTKLSAEAFLSVPDLLHEQSTCLFAASQHPTVTGRVRDGRWEDVLMAPVNDILLRPGKEIRARLVEAGYAMVRPGQSAPAAALALVEILHAGSLVIDDIEDDSKVRRGGKAIHRVHGTPKALNAGNFMYFLAVRQIEELRLSPEATLAMYRFVNQTLLDCHRGQALDLGLHVGEALQSEVPTLVAETSLLKTGALTALATGLGALVAGGSADQVEAMARFGRELGPAPKRYEDLRNGRLTWPWAWAAELLDPLRYKNLEAAALALSVTGHGAKPNPCALAQALLRVAGPHRRHFIVHRLRGMLGELASLFPDPGELAGLREQIRTLEESYV
jgi:geranylgeranyl diphosphate synthase type I